MALINVQLDRCNEACHITQMDESELMVITGWVDNEVERTSWIEHCLIGCEGAAHRTGVPDSESYFCERHVHRELNIVLKKGLFAEGVAALLT